jgi:uncharacterized DUF497 family protein
VERIYNLNIRLVWSERKRRSNLVAHGLDFADAAKVFEGVTVTVEDARFEYRERRFFTLGMLGGVVVSVAHTENENEIRVISFRKATRRETDAFGRAFESR